MPAGIDKIDANFKFKVTACNSVDIVKKVIF